ncbi:MAG: ATP-grasp domain-containing protein [Promethearchaeota archaeon]
MISPLFGQKIKMRKGKIGIVKDINTNWWKRFEEILRRKGINYKLIEIERNDWQTQIADIEFIIWRPNLSEPFLRQAREKIYILERILNKKVYPNQSTFWHYNNKNAQAYLANIYGIKMPKNFVSYSYEDVINYLKNCTYPIVSKAASGAGSKNVRLLKNYKEAYKEINYLYNKGFLNKTKRKLLYKLGLRKIKYDFQKYYVNYQEFVADNNCDFRITTIGNQYAFGFFRQNRKNDFRASGSHKFDYNPSKHDLIAIKYCLDISKGLNFDTMCYDILYSNGRIVLTEFSYIFEDKPIYDCPGYYELKEENLIFINKHIWPQELIVEYLLNKWGLNIER